MRNGGESCDRTCKLVPALVIGFGLMLGGFFPGYYYYKSKTDMNIVTVKGLAEMDVTADLAVWEIKFTVTSDNLQTAQKELSSRYQTIYEFLQKQGLKPEEVSEGRIDTNDLMTNPYRDRNVISRYILTQTVLVRSNNVDLVKKAVNATGELVAKGVVFDSQSYGSPVSYIFTKLNDIKPQMLEEATKNAQAAAEEFAKSSHSKVGKIRRASQGVFSILPREQTANAQEMTQIEKKVRVVSTIESYIN